MEYSKTVGRKQKVSSIIVPIISGNSCHGLSIVLTGDGEWGSSDGNKFFGMRYHAIGNEGKHSVVYVGHRAAQQLYMMCVGGGGTFNFTHHFVLETCDSQRNVCFAWTVYVNCGYPNATF